jgi:hypothetical protein
MDSEKEENRFLLGVTREDYQLWRHHPVTKLVLQYMADFQTALEKRAVGKWLGGSLNLAEDQEIRARINTLIELGELPFEAIESFYQPESEELGTEAH